MDVVLGVLREELVEHQVIDDVDAGADAPEQDLEARPEAEHEVGPGLARAAPGHTPRAEDQDRPYVAA